MFSCDPSSCKNGCDSCINVECGDGIKQPAGPDCILGTQDDEECEDGNIIDFDGCSHLCRTERCGDGVLQPIEQCEDGNVVDNDGCSALCLAEQTVACGNGVLESGETCDDNNLISGDDCSATCVDEQTGVAA